MWSVPELAFGTLALALLFLLCWAANKVYEQREREKALRVGKRPAEWRDAEKETAYLIRHGRSENVR